MNLIKITQRKSDALVIHTQDIIRQMVSAGEVISYVSVAKKAEVSRNFLYSHENLRKMIDACRVSKMTKRELQRELTRLRLKEQK